MMIENKISEHFAAKKANESAKFPLGVLPEKMQKIIAHYAEYRSYPIDFFATSILTATGSAVGNSVTMVTPHGYKNKANLFVLLVASPGVNKSAPLMQSYSYLTSKQAEFYRQYKEEQKNLPEPEKGKKADRGVFIKPLMSDATIEALGMQLTENPKGTTIKVDEAAGVVNNIGRYNKGNDKQLYLSLWQGETFNRDTLTHGTQMAENPFLSIIGTIQPDVLNKVFLEDGDGFFDRWLICYPTKPIKPYPSSKDVDPNIASQFSRYNEFLHRLYYEDTPTELTYTDDAWQVVYKWICQSTDVENDTNTSDRERGIRAKMQIYVHRFALILQLMKYGISENSSDLLHIDFESANAAVAIADYLFAMAEKTRLKEASELITGQLKELYDLLPEDIEFSKAQFLERCEMLEIPERTCNDILKHNVGKLWTKLKHGVYVKL